MNNSLKVGRLFGIDIAIHISWLLVFALFSFTLSEGYFPAEMPRLTKVEYWSLGIITTLLLFGSVLVHEFAHSLVAIKQGIPIKRITLFIFGGVAQLEREPDHPSAEFKITISGPVASFILAFIFGMVYLILPPERGFTEAVNFLARVNFTVALINLVPAFPLDGGRLLRALIWWFKGNLLHATKIAVSIGSIFAIISMGLGFFLVFYYQWIWGLWYIFLGWMVYQAGQGSYSQLIFKQAFANVKVSDIMSDKVVFVPSNLHLDELVEKFFRYKFGAFPVIEGDRVLGLITVHQVKDVPRSEWSKVSAGDVMTPIDKCLCVGPDQEAVEVMMKLASEDTGRALVIQEGQLVGIISRTDMMRLINMHLILGLGEK